ncbi:hypothetical protein [Dongia rigui]|uniref:Uncharacterized protein n=1 Tax=Dongia rigui TaxID=940149 RepID=A0ABU5DZR4_9PROT|nr:hypothetical protein [Dongia rigui]MDY0872826.1 hypothetical protein [Dongia rigui]
MADTFYSINLGKGLSPAAVTVGASSAPTADFEFRIKNGVAGRGKPQVINAIEAIVAKIVTSNAPA